MATLDKNRGIVCRDALCTLISGRNLPMHAERPRTMCSRCAYLPFGWWDLCHPRHHTYIRACTGWRSRSEGQIFDKELGERIYCSPLFVGLDAALDWSPDCAQTTLFILINIVDLSKYKKIHRICPVLIKKMSLTLTKYLCHKKKQQNNQSDTNLI